MKHTPHQHMAHQIGAKIETVLVVLAMDNISSESLPESGTTRPSPLQETSNAATEISASRPLAVGEKFATFAQLDERMSRDSVENCVQLWKREARTIEAAKKRVGKITCRMPEALKYCCVHGGAKFVTKNQGSQKSS